MRGRDSRTQIHIAVKTTTPIILAVLQNQWFQEPDRVRAIIEDGERRYPGKFRRRFIARSLFAGCRTGSNLRRTFGEWCDRIVWEESSREIGGRSESVFIPDVPHLQACLEELKPVVIIGFGNVACCALANLVPADRLIIAPHPTARGGDTLKRLYAARQKLESYF